MPKDKPQDWIYVTKLISGLNFKEYLQLIIKMNNTT